MSNEALKRRLQRALDLVGDGEPHPNAMESRLPKIANDPELKSALAKHADVALWIREIELVDRALRVWPDPSIDDAAFDAMADRIAQRLDEDLPALPEDPTDAPRFDDSDAGRTYDATAGGLAGLTAAAKAAGPPPPPAPNVDGPARAVVAPPPPPPPAPGATRQRGDPTLKGIAPPPPPTASKSGAGAASTSKGGAPPAAKKAPAPPPVATAKPAGPVKRDSGESERISLSSMEEIRESSERLSLSDSGVDVRDDAGAVAIGTQIPESEPPASDESARDVGDRISFSTALRAPNLAALQPPTEAPNPEPTRSRRDVPAALAKDAADARRSDRVVPPAPPSAPRSEAPKAAPVVSLEAAREKRDAKPLEGRSMFWPTVAGVCALAAAAVIAITVQQRAAAPGEVALLDGAERSASEQAPATSTIAPSAPPMAVPPPPAAPSQPPMMPTGAVAAVGPESPAEGGEAAPAAAANPAAPMPAEPEGAAPTLDQRLGQWGAIGGAAGASPRAGADAPGGGLAARSTADGAGFGAGDVPAARDSTTRSAGARGAGTELDDRQSLARADRAQLEGASRERSVRSESDDELIGRSRTAATPTTAAAPRPAPPPEAPPATPAPTPARRPVVAEEAPVDPSTLPETLDRTAVVRGFQSVAAEVRGCSTDGMHGTAQVDVTIANSGRVVGAVVSGGQFAGTPIGSCVARAVRRARFPRFQRATIRVSYPFNL